jgi:hypothetical protein
MPKTTVEQTHEIEELVDDALERLDHVRHALAMLETRLTKPQSESAT